jgi:hypothetical protein
MSYKKILLTAGLLVAILCAKPGVARYFPTHDQSPVLRNTHAIPDYKKSRLTVSYNLAVKPGDGVLVQLLLLDVDNKEISQAKTIITGDIGRDVSATNQKKIDIHFLQAAMLYKVKFVRLIAKTPNTPDLKRLLLDFDSTRLVKTLIAVGKERNHYSEASRKQLTQVRSMIRKSFTNAGMHLSTQYFRVKNIKGENIIGTIRSKKPGAKTLVIGAHYDTVEDSPGLDDNGTGISALMEMATILSKYSFDYNIKFVAFDLEEAINSIPDAEGIEGSAAFVRDSLEKPSQVIGCINLDMIGYSTEIDSTQQFPAELKDVFPELYNRVEQNKFRGNFLLVISNEASASMSQTLQSVNSEFVPQLISLIVPVPGKGEMMPDFRRSDHANFWDKGYPAISLGDGAFSRNPHYHSSEDQFDDINLFFFSSVTKLLLLTIAKEGRLNNSTTMTSKVSNN